MMTLCETEAKPQPQDDATTVRQEILKAAVSGDVEPTMKTSSSATRIVLTGFMGAGKSTVGRLLAAQLGWRFLDVDDAIVEKAGMPVAEVFATYGEFVFRRMETSAIAHALGERDVVIALGGGAPEVLANRLLLEQTPRTNVVFLDAPLVTLLARCNAQEDGPVRPNLPVAEERFRYRQPLYRRVARHRVATGDTSAAESVQAIVTLLGLTI